MSQIVEIFTDGACRGNPGPGGWGVMMRYEGTVKELKGAECDTTNNRMELTAAIKALENLTRPCNVSLTTDSVYVKSGITEWLEGWKRNNWRTANKKPVKNKDLWELLDKLSQIHEINWYWVKGHSGHFENERADELANIAIDNLLNN
jgi:ribonuclease HI